MLSEDKLDYPRELECIILTRELKYIKTQQSSKTDPFRCQLKAIRNVWGVSIKHAMLAEFQA